MADPDRITSSPVGLSGAFAMFFVVWAGGVWFLRQFALEAGLPMNYDRAIFWSANAITLTGFRLSPNGLRDFSAAGIAGVYVLMAFGAMFSMVIGGGLVCRLIGKRISFGALFLAAGSVLGIAALGGGGLLMSPGRSYGAAVFEATGAFANCGMSFDQVRGVGEWQTLLVITPLAALGGMGLPVLIELFEKFTRSHPLSPYSRRAIGLVLTVWVAVAVLLLASNFWSPFRGNVVVSWVSAINSRSLGMDFAYPASLPRVTWWVMTLLMLVGQMPGGTAYGSGLLPLASLWRGSAWSEEQAPAASLVGAVSWLMLFFAAALMLFLMLMSAEPQISTDRLANLACGAISNTGLTQDPISMSTRGLLVMTAGMVAGFLLPIRLMWLIVPRT